ncbi:MAG: hypothetical protein WD768_21185 [Phycisphaeraceae bacterium]
MSSPAAKPPHCLHTLLKLVPRTTDDLHRFVHRALGLQIPRVPIVTGNQAPMDYLTHAFFEDGASGRDLIVWASRGGGKTLLGAVATLLDLIFKPGISICILGGSMEQSSRMFEHLTRLFQPRALARLLAAEPTQRRVKLVNGSEARVLTQSPRSVRGHHVHKLRCDEVDEFQEHIWRAVQLMPRSGACGERFVRGSIEAISTMHKTVGPMSRLIDRAKEAESVKLIRWSVLDVIERCPSARPCETCPIHTDCRGRAKEADGFMPVDDVIAHWHRTSDSTWAAEMMCRRPSVQSAVYPMFDPMPGGRHVMLTSPGGGDRTHGAAMTSDSHRLPEDRPLRRVLTPAGSRLPEPEMQLVGGMDFGIRDPLVMLWARLHAPKGKSRRQCEREELIVEVVDEYAAEGLTMDQNLVQIDERGWPRPVWIGVDPSGASCNRQTGKSDIDLVRKRGYRVRAVGSRISVGIEMIRRRLDRGTLRIDPRCKRLIESLENYRFDPDKPQEVNPKKEGPDHACDALRYLIVNLEFGGGKVEAKGY